VKNKNIKKIIAVSFLLFFLSILMVNAQTNGRELEAKYPEIFGSLPRTVEQTILPIYVKYIFNFLIAASGFIAMTALFIHGIGFLTSINNPEKLERARKGIFAAIFGLIILFSSWIILSVINPDLLNLRFPGAEEIILPYWSLKSPPSPPAYENWLWRITEIADSVKILSQESIKSSAEDIYFLTSICDCMHSQPLCTLQENDPDKISYNYMTGECKALYCYSANETQPCPDGPEIKLRQKDLVDSLYKILYYKKRAVEERKDFLIKIENIEKQISHKDKEIKAEKEFLNKIEGEDGKKQQEKLINNIEKSKGELIKKYNLYSELEKELNNLTILIDKVIPPANNLSELPNQCLLNIRSKCVGSCQGGGHDTPGCFPTTDFSNACKGKEQGKENPCPTKEIKQEMEKVGFSVNIINSTADNIINLVKEIINL